MHAQMLKDWIYTSGIDSGAFRNMFLLKLLFTMALRLWQISLSKRDLTVSWLSVDKAEVSCWGTTQRSVYTLSILYFSTTVVTK